MGDAVAVTLERDGPRPRFGLRARDGSAPEIVGAVIEDRSGTRLWWIALAELTELNPALTDEQAMAELEAIDREGDVTPADAFTQPDGPDPVEDLPPSDWRYQRALQRLDSMKAAGPRIGSLSFGVVPEGFRQLLPDAPHVASLPAGRAYALHVMAADGAGHLSFRVE